MMASPESTSQPRADVTSAALALGHYFRDFRIARQLSLTAATGGQFNSALSRFEQGRTMLSNDRLYQVMANLAMSPADLRDAGLMFTNALEHAYLQLRALRWAPSADGVAAVVAEYRTATRGRTDQLHRLTQGVLDHVAASVAAQRVLPLTDAVSEGLDWLLMPAGQWLTSDYWLLTLAAPYLNAWQADRYVTAARKQTVAHSLYRGAQAYALAGLLLAEVRTNGAHHQAALIAAVRQYQDDAHNADGRWSFSLIIAAVQSRTGAADGQRAVIEQACALGLAQSAEYLARCDAYLAGEGDGFL